MGRKTKMTMTATIDKGFEGRLKKVEKRRNSRLIQGYLMSDNVDGYAVARIRKVERGSALAPVLIGLTLVVLAKSLAIAWIGAATYAGQIEELSLGTASERLAAFIMQPDPLTGAIAELAGPLMH